MYKKHFITILSVASIVIITLFLIMFSRTPNKITESDFFDSANNTPLLTLINTTNQQGRPTVTVANLKTKKIIKDDISSIDEVFQTMPYLLSNPQYVDILAVTVNHLARENDYSVILDLETYKHTYSTNFETLSTPSEFDAHNVGPQSFGRSDLSLIERPKIEKGVLEFFAHSNKYRIPYKVTFDLNQKSGQPAYNPVQIISEN